MFILAGQWIPIFHAVHGSLYYERCFDPYIQNGPWIPVFPAPGFISFQFFINRKLYSFEWFLYRAKRSVDPSLSPANVKMVVYDNYMIDPHFLSFPKKVGVKIGGKSWGRFFLREYPHISDSTEISGTK